MSPPSLFKSQLLGERAKKVSIQCNAFPWHRSLHHTCNYLIALSSLGSAFYQLGYFPVYAILFNGWSQVRQDTCFLLQALPLFGKTFSLAMLLAIGLDRLRAVTIGWSA
jgi:hypothetical protein